MKLSLIICTYKRHKAIIHLLESVQIQSLYPDEILVIDGSPDCLTKKVLEQKKYKNLTYFQVEEQDRGLTRQRNIGISKIGNTIDIVAFLDDDTLPHKTYFEELIKVYNKYPEASGVGGYITNEVIWHPVTENYNPNSNEFVFDGFKRTDGSRFVLRKKLGLDSDKPPGFAPEFGHGRSISFLPPSGKIYPVEQLMGGAASYPKEIFTKLRFSTYFEGYGLYEDADFTLRLSNLGNIYINTAAQLEHHHDSSGRPNMYQYGKMVVRNGWYVWRVKHPKPPLKARIKWHSITLLLTGIRYLNVLTIPKRKESFYEAMGRTIAWWGLLFYKPKVQR